MSNNTDQLQALVAELQRKVDALQSQSEAQTIPDEDLAIIAATAAAYLGIKGKVKAIQFAGRSTTTSLASA